MKHKTIDLMKFKRLQRSLSLPLYAAVGLLESLWIVTQTNSPQGDIGRLSDDDIAMMLEWPGSPSELIEAFVSAGFVDRDGDKYSPGEGWRLIIHDWHEECPTWIKGNLCSRDVGFAISGGLSKVLSTPAKHGAKGGRSRRSANSPPLPNLTQPNPIETPQGSLRGGCTTDARDGHGDKPPKTGRGDAKTKAEVRRDGIEFQLAKIERRLRSEGMTDEAEVRRCAINEYNESVSAS